MMQGFFNLALDHLMATLELGEMHVNSHQRGPPCC
jgi:hypothetical protein